MKSMSEIEWIPVVIRPTTDEEKEEFGSGCDWYMDFKRPDEDEQMILVTLTNGNVTIDYYDADWGGLENFDWEDVKAWAEMPKGYGCEN